MVLNVHRLIREGNVYPSPTKSYKILIVRTITLIWLHQFTSLKIFVIYYSKPSEVRSCVKVEVAVLGSLSLISLMVSVGVKQH